MTVRSAGFRRPGRLPGGDACERAAGPAEGPRLGLAAKRTGPGSRDTGTKRPKSAWWFGGFKKFLSKAEKRDAETQDGPGEGDIVTSPEATSWQSLVRARMQEEIDEWVAEGRRQAQTDRPLVLIDVIGVVSDASPKSPPDGDEPANRSAEDGAFDIPSYMPALVRHLVEVADVRWSTPLDDELSTKLTAGLGVGPLPSIEPDEYGMTEPAARELLWKAASAGRATYRIENVSSEIPSRLPDSTVLINLAPDKVLRPDHLPPELRPT